MEEHCDATNLEVITVNFYISNRVATTLSKFVCPFVIFSLEIASIEKVCISVVCRAFLAIFVAVFFAFVSEQNFKFFFILRKSIQGPVLKRPTIYLVGH